MIQHLSPGKPAFSRINFAPAAVDVMPLADGGMILRSPQRLGPYGRCLGELLEHWGQETPQQVFLAERPPPGAVLPPGRGGWRQITYAEALRQVQAIGQALLDRGLSAERPVLILSDNSIDHALLMLAAMHVGIPAAPVSPAYSLVSKDFAKLRHIVELLAPGLVYAADGQQFAPALRALNRAELEIVVSANPPDDLATTPFASLRTCSPRPQVEEAFRRITPDTIAKFLFTSGSTGLPKGVINTQRMLCSNQQAITQVWPFLVEKPPVIVDWLPWNHTFGGNHNFNMILRHGGTLYIDDGKPAPGLIERTVVNLSEISPSLYFNVPRGFDMLLPYLERDETLRNTFFHHLDLIFYAGAALPQNLWGWLEDLAVQTRGQRVPLVSAWGATETAPMVTTVHFPIEQAGVIGLPAPGCTLKMLPNAGKLELRIRGPNVTPGYWKRDDLTAAAFDPEGYYCIGDAGRLVETGDPARGIAFDGRIAEDFKLMSGTWVHVGALRLAFIAAAAPIIQDAVITGHNREEVGVLAFASPTGCASLCPHLPADTPLPVLITRHEIRQHLTKALQTLAAAATGSSTRIHRALLMADPPSIDANEITDKGYINQRMVLMHRASLVEQLYSDTPDQDVISI